MLSELLPLDQLIEIGSRPPYRLLFIKATSPIWSQILTLSKTVICKGV